MEAPAHRQQATGSLTLVSHLRRRARARVEEFLSAAGLALNGSAPWDPTVLDERFYARVLRGGSLALGESYADGWWRCDDLAGFFYRLLRTHRSDSRSPIELWARLRARAVNLQSRLRSRMVARRHYDLDSSFFMSFLDAYNQYTCAYFAGTDDLETAQRRKLELICTKLGLRRGMRVLDIGCGWGGFARYAAQEHGVEVTGLTLSRSQAEFARRHCAGLPVQVVVRDYRDFDGRFDRVLVCGMIEHVGYKNYRSLMERVAGFLRPDGLFLLHTIGRNTSAVVGDPWITRYVFPNSMLPSLPQLTAALEGLFVVEDVHNLGAHYDHTLVAWHERLRLAWSRLGRRFEDRTYRVWRYYLLSCAGAFRARALQLWQIVLSPRGVPGGYVAPR